MELDELGKVVAGGRAHGGELDGDESDREKKKKPPGEFFDPRIDRSDTNCQEPGWI